MAEQIETKTSEELGLIMARAYEQIAASQTDIRLIAHELSQRQQRHNDVEKQVVNVEPKTQ